MTKTFDAIFVTDTPTYPTWTRGYGAHRLASQLRERGYSVLVVDFSMALTFDLWTSICKLAIGENTRFVGFSTTWWPYTNDFQDDSTVNLTPNIIDLYNKDYRNSLNMNRSVDFQANTFTKAAVAGQAQPWVDVVKQCNKKTKIIIGGAKLDLYPTFPADHKFGGLSETEVIDFLEQPKRIWPTFINHDPGAANKELWDWSHSMTLYSDYDMLRSNETLVIEFARGCKFKCLFCAYPLVGQKNIADYIKNTDTVFIELMENYRNWGITTYFIADDTFNDSTEKMKYLAEVVKLLPFKPRFRAYYRLDVLAMNPEQLQLTLDIGIDTVLFGIDSFHPSASKFVGKGMSQEKRKKALYDVQKVWGDKVFIDASYIVGLPGESEEFIREQHKWFMDPECPVHSVLYHPLMIIPEGIFINYSNSELDKTYEQRGYTIPDKKDFMNWHKVEEDGSNIPNFKRAFELSNELTTDMKTIKKKKFTLGGWYGHGDVINDPVQEYFLPLIEKLNKRRNNGV